MGSAAEAWVALLGSAAEAWVAVLELSTFVYVNFAAIRRATQPGHPSVTSPCPLIGDEIKTVWCVWCML